jgi:hypothetical protein
MIIYAPLQASRLQFVKPRLAQIVLRAAASE